jgi:hypothetical protein
MTAQIEMVYLENLVPTNNPYSRFKQLLPIAVLSPMLELIVLKETGYYSSFTFSSARGDTPPAMANEIYMPKMIQKSPNHMIKVS